MSAVSLKGRCHCGGVELTIEGEAFGVVACHCEDCRRVHGNYMAVVAADRDAVKLAKDETLTWYASSEKARRGFCSRCGARLFKDATGSPKLLVSVGVLDLPTGMRIRKNVWGQSKGDWYELPVEEGT